MLDREEFEHSLRGADGYWLQKNAEEIACLLGCDAARMHGFDQRNPHHCFELLEHAVMTVENLRNDEVYLAVAAFLHDIGKPHVAMEKNGRLVFYGHAAKSADIAARLLGRLGYGAEEIELVTFYVRRHDDFISYVLPSEARNNRNPYLVAINEDSIRKYVLSLLSRNPALTERYGVRNLMMNLLDLCEADVRSQAVLAYMDGTIIDSMAHKLLKLDEVRREMDVVLGEEPV